MMILAPKRRQQAEGSGGKVACEPDVVLCLQWGPGGREEENEKGSRSTEGPEYKSRARRE